MKILPFVCIYGLNPHFKCIFKNRKNKKLFSCGALLLYVVIKFLLKCPYSKKRVLPPKIPGCTPITFSLTFHPNFHPSILVFANLPIYRKLIHDNVSLMFWKRRIFDLVLFWRRFKKLSVHINIWTCFFLSEQKKFFKKRQNHKFLNKTSRSNGEVAKFSETYLLYDIN